MVTGTNAAGIVLPRLAAQLAALRQQRAEVAEKVEELVAAHPLSKVLTTMPGVGVRTCARILTEVVGKDFPTAGHLASYAGLAPVTRRSGTSIRGEHPPRGGNKVLKRALFLSAFAALNDPVSRAYYDRKRAAGRRNTTRPSSPSPAAAPTSSTPCSETAPSTTSLPRPPDNRHRTPAPQAPRSVPGTNAKPEKILRNGLAKNIGTPPPVSQKARSSG